ncbi:hypothetical protein [Clostridium sp. MD294]|uniref:hypothetical protein n=1 Tax=Clostridium sp. MD294 TaxID=97138 RepID=UPI0002CC8551|nr:hypothetical protein [Clostridium sp. MD294]NDO45802.1 hypothetical protein [Clostridium sp. MD294]USF30543.1 hypothetical protein C820_001984 [Clostridium sp. MD294]
MELNINSPAYFKEHYGVDDEVYKFCQKAYVFFKDKEYSDILHIVGIIPVVAPQEIYDNGKWQESIKFLCNKSIASITIRMNFENYYKANSLEKVEQTKEMILTAIKRIKSKGKFNYNKFKNDLLYLK